MTGATPFTRTAGAMGLAIVPAILLAVVAAMASVLDAPLLTFVAFLGFAVLVVCSPVFFVGLLARHRGQWWVLPVAVLTTLSLVAGLGRAHGLSQVLGAAATILVAYGIAKAGTLPRGAAVPFLLGAVGALMLGSTPLASILLLVGLAGVLLLAWAMWREPLPGEARSGDDDTTVPVSA